MTICGIRFSYNNGSAYAMHGRPNVTDRCNLPEGHAGQHDRIRVPAPTPEPGSGKENRNAGTGVGRTATDPVRSAPRLRSDGAPGIGADPLVESAAVSGEPEVP